MLSQLFTIFSFPKILSLLENAYANKPVVNQISQRVNMIFLTTYILLPSSLPLFLVVSV